MTQKMLHIKSVVLPMLALAVLSTVFGSCKDKGETVSGMVPSVSVRQLNISSHKLEYGPASQGQTVQVKSNSTAWEFTDIPSWITVTPSKGSGWNTDVRVSVSLNSNISGRVGTLTLRSLEGDWNYSTQLTVTQQRARYYAIPQPGSLVLDGGAGSGSVGISSNNANAWYASVPAGASSWCTATKNGSSLTVTVSANTTGLSRSVNVEVVTSESLEYLTVTQRPANISSTTQELTFAVGGGKQSVQVQSEAAWTARTSYSWIDVTPQTGQAGTASVSVRALPNNTTQDRTGYVYLELSSQNRMEIPVMQEGLHLSVDRTDMEFPVTASSAKLQVQSNAAWQFADGMPAWISVTPSSGTGNQTVTVKVTGHSSADPRQARLSISPTAVDNPHYINIFQAGHTLEADSTSLHFSARAGQLTFQLESDADWVAASANEWISVTPASGSGGQTITVAVTANESVDARTGSVTVGIDDKTLTIPVHQAGRYISVTSEALDFSSKGGSTQVSLSSNTDWTIEPGTDWLTASADGGSDNGSVTVTAKDNPSATPRSGKVTVTAKGLVPVVISVNQDARYLRTSADTLTFFKKGGTSDVVLIETDGVCEIANTTAWITVNRLTDTQFTVTAQEYTDGVEDRRATLTLSLTDVTSGTVSKEITVEQQHPGAPEYVDLGLSVRWATFNVGAEKPEDYGDYFAWGETVGDPYVSGKTSGYAKSFDWPTYKYCEGSGDAMVKYCSNSMYGYNGFTDNKAVLDMEDDAARVNWGGNWRLPTDAEFDELLNEDNCTWIWCDDKNSEFAGVAGYKVVSKKSDFAGNFIFIPAAGHRVGTYLNNIGNEDYNIGYYWSSSLGSDPDRAWYLNLYSHILKTGTYRSDGLTVRPVCPVPVTGISLNRQSVEIMEGGTETLTATVQLENGVTVNTATWTSSNAGVATVDQTGKITAISAGICNITASSGSFTATCSVTVKSSPYKYVDLGLSVKWATCNVGAAAPEDYGDYFAWGATEPWYQPGYAQSGSPVWKSGKSAGYTWVNTPYQTASTTDYSSTKWTKYLGSTTSSYKDASATDANALKTVLDPADDAAHANWGGSWRMPTKAEQDELRNTDNCTWTRTTLNGVNGYKVVSKKSGYAGNWIFLPAAGYRSDTYLNNVGYFGYYWASSLLGSHNAYYLDFSSVNVDWFNSLRYYGQSVRPVCPVPVTGLSLNRQSVEIMEGGTEALTATVRLENGVTVNTATWTSSNAGVATVDQTGKVTAVSVGNCTITASSGSCTATCSVTVKPWEPQYVDLGLSVKWATCNVGATAPEGYGDYFAWGATEPWYQPGYAQSGSPVWRSGKSAGYTWVNTPYQTANTTSNSSTKWTKYLGSTTSSYKDASATSADALKTVLDPADDAAHANWGSSWRMPTKAEQDELRNTDNCTWTWTTLNGVNGYKVVSKKSGYAGNWIFLPAAGCRYDTYLVDVGSYGYYRSSSLYTSYPYSAYGLYFHSSSVGWDYYDRYLGQSVRPVCPVPVTSLSLDRQSVEIMQGGTETLTANVQLENGVTVNVATWSSSNTSVATVDQTGKITAISAGTCTITASSGSFTATCSVTVKAFEPVYVDLGLSVKWATCNVGATAPEDYGDYFAWGETSPKSDYSWSTYKYCKGSYDSMTKYCNNSSYGYNGFTDSKTVLDPADDAAHVNWGGSWRMPTSDDWAELRNTDNCTWTWTTLNGVSGYKVVSKKSGYAGNWIFLPALGCRSEWFLFIDSSYGYYWSSSLLTSDPYSAYYLGFDSSGVGWYDHNRFSGLSVRPVCPAPATSLGLDRQSVEIMEGNAVTLTATVQLENGVTVNTATWSSSNTSIATVDQTGKITAISAGTCNITASSGSFTATCSVTVNPWEPQYVDLGLSVKWATCNVGATAPEGYGDYFAWGATEPWYQPGYAQSGNPVWKSGKSAGYTWVNTPYQTANTTSYWSTQFTKYLGSTTSDYKDASATDADALKTVLDLADDAARANWGGSWRMPTSDDWAELRNTDNCTWTWTMLNGVKGYKVVSKKSGYAGNWIFLPAAGDRNGAYLDSVGSFGYYWSSSLYASYPSYAYYLDFNSSSVDWNDSPRNGGRSVRPVCP